MRKWRSFPENSVNTTGHQNATKTTTISYVWRKQRYFLLDLWKSLELWQVSNALLSAETCQKCACICACISFYRCYSIVYLWLGAPKPIGWIYIYIYTSYGLGSYQKVPSLKKSRKEHSSASSVEHRKVFIFGFF